MRNQKSVLYSSHSASVLFVISIKESNSMLTHIKCHIMHEGKFLFTILMMFLITLQLYKNRKQPHC